jgi:hypothetical protein
MKSKKFILNKKGNVLLYAIIAMTMISLLGTGVYYMTSTSTFSGLSTNNLNKAYSLAVAGKEYALIKNLPDTGGKNFTLANGDKFKLVISGDNIDSTGIVNEGTPFETKRKISVTKAGFSSQADISFAKSIDSFTSPVQSQAGFITTDTGVGKISLGKIGMGSSFGALWYTGNIAQGGCQNGKCTFGTGVRAFFIFQLASGSSGDGFTFAIFNGASNNLTSVGGGFSGGSSMGELMGYAGDSRIDATHFLDGTGTGILPPKIAIEFDPYENDGGCNDPRWCASNNRCDGINDHMAHVYWGDNAAVDVCTDISGGNRASYDDNKHGAGRSANPQNARSFRATGGIDPTSYFNGSALGLPSNWLTNFPTNVYAFRVEVTRDLTENAPGSGMYNYTIKSWIKWCGSDTSCSTIPQGYENTKTSYGVSPIDTPILNRTIELSGAYHNNFDKFLFGWTVATGGATLDVTIRNFKMNFVK